MFLQRLALSFVIFLCASIALGQGEGARLDTEYKAFWYRLPLAEDEETLIQQEALTHAEYQKRKDVRIEGELQPMYEEFLLDNFENAEAYGYDEEKARLMVMMNETDSQRVKDNPEFRMDVAKRLAEWTFFYEQLELWRQFVEESVIREDLTQEASLDYNVATVKTNLPKMHESLLQQAETVSQKLYLLYKNPSSSNPGLVDRIMYNNQLRKEYQSWLERNRSNMLGFVERWMRQYDGSEFWIDGTQYLVRNVADRPQDPEDDTVRWSLPQNAVLLEVAKEKIVTPYDLIKADGTLKKPEDMENF